MSDREDKRNPKNQGLITSAGETLKQDEVTWDSLGPAFEGLFHFLSTQSYNTFNLDYINKHSDSEGGAGEGWADSELYSLLEMFHYSKAINLVGGVNSQHTISIGTDYAQDIYNDLLEGNWL